MRYPTTRHILPGLLALAALDLGVARGADESVAADKAAVVLGGNRFAVDLYARLRQDEDNLFLSPYSISTALAMTSAGARGATLQQMIRTLHLSEPTRLHPAMADLIREVQGAGKEERGYQLSTANALWGQRGDPFRQEFLELTRRSYAAGLREVDFARATEQARRTINAWVEKETRDKIKELLKRGEITADTHLVLTNAIYFKGSWDSPFKKHLTRKEAFHAGGRKVNVPLMHQRAEFRYLNGGAFQALEMPYAGNDLSMVVLLPKKADGLAALERSLTANNLQEWLKQLDQYEVDVTFPRFKVTSELDLKETLASLGMPLAFSQQDADFSGITGSKGLFISAVRHKAFVDVNEQGTEAGAATGFEGWMTGRPRAVQVFRADHPFLFLIRNVRSGSILFLGRLTDPAKGEGTAEAPGRPEFSRVTPPDREADKLEQKAAAYLAYAKKLVGRGERVKAKERLREIVQTLPSTRAAVEAKQLLGTLE